MKPLSEYIQQIQDKVPGEEARCIKEYGLYACQLIRKHPFWDKIPQIEALAEKAICAFIKQAEGENKTQDYYYQKKFDQILDLQVKESLSLTLKSLCLEVHQAGEGAEERLRSYELNILTIIQKSRYSEALRNHAEIAKRVMDEFTAQVKGKGVEGINNLYNYLMTITYTRMINQLRAEQGKIVQFLEDIPPDLFPPADLPYTSLPSSEDLFLKELSMERMRTILHELFKGLTRTEQRLLVEKHYKKKSFQAIAQELSPLLFGNKVEESTISRWTKKARQKLLKGFNQRGINDLNDL